MSVHFARLRLGGNLRKRPWLRAGLAAMLCLASTAAGQTLLTPTTLTWAQIRDRMLAANSTVLAGLTGIDESRASEITALLRPNPDFSLSADGFQVNPYRGVYRPLSGVVLTPGASYLIERGQKRPLRGDSARLATSGSISDQEDLKRNLIYNARTSYVATLQAQALLDLAQDNLKYYDNVISVNRARLGAGDISQLDFKRVEIQRVQFASDLANAIVNLRTAKIQLLALLEDRTPVNDFNVIGDINFKEAALVLSELRQIAINNRPDLRSAGIAIEKARADNRLAIANGTADPTVSAWYSRNPSFSNPFDNNTIGGSVNIPLRIFDRNQGEKARTSLEIQRAQRLRDALSVSIFRDVDSAYETVESVRVLLQPYRDKYLQESGEIRDTVSFSFNQGAATLLEFLDAQKSYRDTQVQYVNLEGSFWSALAQLSLAVGQEVTP
jgi:cobalt-zinc-cadmium efflux system outer membrane protein